MPIHTFIYVHQTGNVEFLNHNKKGTFCWCCVRKTLVSQGHDQSQTAGRNRKWLSVEIFSSAYDACQLTSGGIKFGANNFSTRRSNNLCYVAANFLSSFMIYVNFNRKHVNQLALT